MKQQHIGILVTGGIAAYKVPQLIRDLIRGGAEVRVAMTKSAQQFVTPLTLATVSKNPVLTDGVGISADAKHIDHVEFAHWLDVAVIVPATANTIAKLAAGLADNIVTETLLAFNGPKLLVPAMNDQMWLSKRTQLNIARLADTEFTLLQPAEGMLAEGYAAVGRLPELSVIQLFINSFKQDKILTGKRVLVSAGGTSEVIDPVRLLTNRSSGKMGTSLANAAAALGAAVTLVTTKDLPTLPAVKIDHVSSAQEMATAMANHFQQADIIIMAAAVADFRPEHTSNQKIKKQDNSTTLDLHLVQNTDILAKLGQKKNASQYVAGFAAETTNLVANAKTKLAHKHADLIIANSVDNGRGFDQPNNKVTLLTNSKQIELANQDKLTLAFEILTFIQQEQSK